MSDVVAAGVATVALSWLGTRLALVIARRAEVIATPNERSSHTVPTPSGGGIGLGAAAVLVLAVAAACGAGDVLAVAAAALAAACWCGWRDDARPLPPALKMALLTAVALALALIAPVRGVDVPRLGALDFGVLAIPLTVFWLAGFANAFNFMDGIDGIAAGTALVSGAAYAVAGALFGDATLALVGVVTAGAALGFLPWNFPRARIFMGDAGSLVLGLLLAFAATAAQQSGALPFPASVLLLGPFVFDASFTLLRRLLRGERVWQAHREHLYQRLSRLWGGHSRVTVLYAVLSCASATAALLYRGLGPTGRLLSIGVPLAAMLAFAATVLVADRMGKSTRMGSRTERPE